MHELEKSIILHSIGYTAEGADQEPELGRLKVIASCIMKGQYATALQQQPILALLSLDKNCDVKTPGEYYKWIQDKIVNTAHISLGSEHEDGQELLHSVLLAAVACLCTFIQHNLTGPFLPVPPSPLQLFAPHVYDTHPDNEVEVEVLHSDSLGRGTMHIHECWAASELQLDGEETVGRCSCYQHLLLAEALLLAPLLRQQVDGGEDSYVAEGAGHGSSQGDSSQHDLLPPESSCSLPASLAQSTAATGRRPHGKATILEFHNVFLTHTKASVPTWLWWSLRATVLHQHILAGRSTTLLARSRLLLSQLEPWIINESSWDSLGSGLQDRTSMQAALSMEIALLHYHFGYTEQAKKMLEVAGGKLGIEVALSGSMGKRTVHQVDAKAQLVVKAARSRAFSDEEWNGYKGVRCSLLGLDGSRSTDLASGEGGPSRKETVGLEEEPDVYMAPVLVAEDGEAINPAYSVLEQTLLLAWCTHVKKGTSKDELQAWEMAPYVDAVMSQSKSHFMLQAAARLQKVRHERTRNRTRERALLSAEQLTEAMMMTTSPSQQSGSSQQGNLEEDEDSLSSAAIQRLSLAFTVWFPLNVIMKKEIAEQYISMGFIGAALKSLEELELWDSLITCYRLLEKKNLAEELIARRLKVTPDDPRLWNALGDMSMEDGPYLEAWNRSKGRNARSKRSLGRSAMRRKDYQAAAAHLEDALALNLWSPDSWFALGFAYVKLEQPEKALKAFQRVTQQEPDHGEAWNNIAAIWMQFERYKEAFCALSECVKHKRDSWQVWENYALIAVKSRQYVAGVRGLRQVLSLSSGQRLKMEVLEGLLVALEKWGKETVMPAAESAVNGRVSSEDSDVDPDDLSLAEFVLPGLPLFSSVPMPDDGVSDALDGSESTEVEGESAISSDELRLRRDAASDERMRQQVLAGVGEVLKQAVNMSCCTPEVWGFLGRWYGLYGELEARKEALLKQVRGLTSTTFKSDEPRFCAIAAASLQLCRAYVDLSKRASAAPMISDLTAVDMSGNGSSKLPLKATEGTGGVRDLAAARMHLRGILKQCEASFEDHPQFKEMKHLLDEIVEMESTRTSH
ncbi:hypothetical protein CEUSTIGMA_g1227.t1 [Chlamydomonas eustigma]|uniref:Uncharacterized protein n=1 Tax=Chlamydomonas eustigma TaxID=1157962 RepID=A0A250WSQ8_9CHLO|nr:hypothetical protein CEUSTIGMA_g1227.t1 [Chlamydomonas eustigma]|eukprot:GAX73776.1 hypothetical protein CEUSTIGMA_g1227.t1 [Chlamydomonas eustigma]